MATKQTRRSISVRGMTYDKLRQYCETSDRSMSDVVEELLAKILDTVEPAAVKPAAAAPAPALLKERSASRLRFNPPPIVREKRTALANRVVRAVPPSPPPRAVSRGPALPGRPAPTPAAAVLGKPRAVASASKDDYRTMKF
jgi:hypothetical protein